MRVEKKAAVKRRSTIKRCLFLLLKAALQVERRIQVREVG
jgi:hypothetical protein